LSIIKELIQNPKYFACGVGVINNKGEKAKGVLCTEVNVIDPATGNCKPTSGPSTEPYKPAEGLFCVQWLAGDNNLCVGDFGGKFNF
jgi:hypothetical protein